MAYVAPTPAELKAAFPAFVSTSDATVQFWIDRAARSVDQTWTEGDYAYAIMLLAAHLMSAQGAVTGGSSGGMDMTGIKSVRSGAFSMERMTSADEGGASVPGEYAASPYGRQFWLLLRQNRAGARVATGRVIAGCGAYRSGPLPWQ